MSDLFRCSNCGKPIDFTGSPVSSCTCGETNLEVNHLCMATDRWLIHNLLLKPSDTSALYTEAELRHRGYDVTEIKKDFQKFLDSIKRKEKGETP